MDGLTPDANAARVIREMLLVERTAAAVCRRAFVKVDEPVMHTVVKRSIAAHQQAADLLRAHLCHHDIPLPRDVVRSERRGETLIEQADSADNTLEIVQRVEQQIIEGYRRALATPSLMPDCRAVIELFLLPDRVVTTRSLASASIALRW